MSAVPGRPVGPADQTLIDRHDLLTTFGPRGRQAGDDQHAAAELWAGRWGAEEYRDEQQGQVALRD
jgi:hypothetical protein